MVCVSDEWLIHAVVWFSTSSWFISHSVPPFSHSLGNNCPACSKLTPHSHKEKYTVCFGQQKRAVQTKLGNLSIKLNINSLKISIHSCCVKIASSLGNNGIYYCLWKIYDNKCVLIALVSNGNKPLISQQQMHAL